MTTAEFASTAEMRTRSLNRRRDAIREKMREAGLELLVLYASPYHSFFQATNVCWYLSGFRQMGNSAILLPAEGEVTLIMTPPWDVARAKERAVNVDTIIATDDESFFNTVADSLRKQGLLSKRTGFANGIFTLTGGSQGRSTTEAWHAVLGREPENAEKLVSDLAKIRDEWSLHCARKATAIAEEGYTRMLEAAQPGMPEHEVAAILDVYMRELGAEDNFQIMSASQHNRLVHQPMERRLEAGDVLLGEISPAYEGEYVQICRTAVIGKPSNLQLEKFALLDAGLKAGMKAAKPGTPSSEVVAAVNQPLIDAGYETYVKPPYMRTRGHACGLGSQDPQIDLICGHVMEKGMVFVMHPNQYIPETGYFMCGEPVMITDNGAESLTKKIGTLDAIL